MGCYLHCKKCGVTEHPRGAIFYCFRGNSMGYHGNSKILLPWGVQLHHVFYSVALSELPGLYAVYIMYLLSFCENFCGLSMAEKVSSFSEETCIYSFVGVACFNYNNCTGSWD